MRLARQVSKTDLQRFSETVHKLHGFTTPENLPRHIVDCIGPLFRSASTHFSELNPVDRRVFTIASPALDEPLTLARVLGRYMHQHPVIRYHHRTGDGSAHRMSDFLSREAFHRLPLYSKAYGRAGLEFQMSVTLPAAEPVLLGVLVHRSADDVDFSERDRMLMNMLRPHLVQVHENAVRLQEIKTELEGPRSALEALDDGVALLDRELRVKWWTRRAWVAACRHFIEAPPQEAKLPQPLEEWLSCQLHRRDASPRELTPFVRESDGARLTIRIRPDIAGRQFVLRFEERFAAPLFQPGRLVGLGLTQRESEVLCWVCAGDSNRRIGQRLRISTRTVQKHLEHVFTKLDVKTRTAAIAAALRAMGISSCRAMF
jgi:DNA-binding CsgD family transcriptional regulator